MHELCLTILKKKVSRYIFDAIENQLSCYINVSFLSKFVNINMSTTIIFEKNKQCWLSFLREEQYKTL